ncbi:predicted protein [Coccidioides posadasii str. Silveira]|uniref:Predicted protein n=2 Tax=Coccidioides posadasii TaxID=199306 RepID=E9DFW0_COCPS|nr:predicted protein [Coccidioides posadasii str. Silveira]KMM63718.1 hypothetical protein CPAG_00072 [Coccidioides posadasii RMSCC 3488]
MRAVRRSARPRPRPFWTSERPAKPRTPDGADDETQKTSLPGDPVEPALFVEIASRKPPCRWRHLALLTCTCLCSCRYKTYYFYLLAVDPSLPALPFNSQGPSATFEQKAPFMH